MCNLIAKQPSFYCIEHKESTNKNKKINNINQNEKLNCSGINNKGANCKAGAKLKIGDNWYCFKIRICKQRASYSDNGNSFCDYGV